MAIFAVQIALTIALASSVTAQISSGYATYSNGGGGVCPGSSGLPSVSLNAAQFANGAACGQCVQISGTGKGAGQNPVSTAPYIASVGNVCPQCAYGDIDLQESGDGKFGITWSFVGCPGAGRKLIEQPFNGDTTVYTVGAHKEQATEETKEVEQVQEVPSEQEAASPQEEEKHFIVHQAQHFIIHQKQDEPIPATMTAQAEDSTDEIQTPTTTEAKIEDVHESEGASAEASEDNSVQAVQKSSRRLLKA